MCLGPHWLWGPVVQAGGLRPLGKCVVLQLAQGSRSPLRAGGWRSGQVGQLPQAHVIPVLTSLWATTSPTCHQIVTYPTSVRGRVPAAKAPGHAT